MNEKDGRRRIDAMVKQMVESGTTVEYARKKAVEAAKKRRENSLNTEKGKSRIMGLVKNSPRNKTLVLREKKNGKDAGQITAILSFHVA